MFGQKEGMQRTVGWREMYRTRVIVVVRDFREAAQTKCAIVLSLKIAVNAATTAEVGGMGREEATDEGVSGGVLEFS